MIKFFILATVLISCSQESHEKYILFEYVGPMDKPIECVVVIKQDTFVKKLCELQKKHHLAGEEYEQFEKYIVNKDPKLKEFDTSRTFGSFRVHINGKGSYFVSGRQKSIEYFTDLNKFLKNGSDLELAEIIEETILIRIREFEQ